MTAYIVDQERGLDHKRYENFRKANEITFKGGYAKGLARL